MKYINNWLRKLASDFASGSVPSLEGSSLDSLGLSEGESCRLTVTDSIDPTDNPVFEIIGVAYVGGDYQISRGMESTTVRSWPAGSYIYAGVTAGILSLLQASASGGGDDIALHNMEAGTYQVTSRTKFIYQVIGLPWVGGDVIHELMNDPCAFDLLISCGSVEGNNYRLRYMHEFDYVETVRFFGASSAVEYAIKTSAQAADQRAEISIASGSGRNLLMRVVAGNSSLFVTVLQEWAE